MRGATTLAVMAHLLIDGLDECEDVPGWEGFLLLQLQQDDDLVLAHAGQAT